MKWRAILEHLHVHTGRMENHDGERIAHKPQECHWWYKAALQMLKILFSDFADTLIMPCKCFFFQTDVSCVTFVFFEISLFIWSLVVHGFCKSGKYNLRFLDNKFESFAQQCWCIETSQELLTLFHPKCFLIFRKHNNLRQEGEINIEQDKVNTADSELIFLIILLISQN